MTNPQKTRRNPIENSKYAPSQPPADDRRQRLEALGQDPAEIARGKREIAQMSRQQGGRASAAIQLDGVEVQERRPRQTYIAPQSLPPAPSSDADVPQAVEIDQSLDTPAKVAPPSPASKDLPVQKSGVSTQKKPQASGATQPSGRMFEHIEHQPVRSAAPARSMPVAQRAAYPRDERYSSRPTLRDVYQPWEMHGSPTRIQPLVLLSLVALVSIAVIWMFLQSPNKTFISTHTGSGWTDTVGNAVSGLLFKQEPESPIASANVAVGEHSVLGKPSIDAAAIDTILAKYGSPAAGTGQAWVTLGQHYGIDPAYAVAFFIHESSAGTNPGWAGIKPDGSSTHNVGNIICAGYATCYNRFRDYASWDEGIADWYKLISHEYVGGRGAASVEQIIPIYAPSFENDVNTYVQTVISLVHGWRQGVLR